MSSFALAGGNSRKNSCPNASSHVIRRLGSYANNLLSKSNPASDKVTPPLGDIFGNFLRRLLYGWWGNLIFRTDGRLMKLGQIFSFGVPSSRNMRSIWSISVLPWNSGSLHSSSPMMHPRLQTSTPVLYSL